MPGPWFAGHPLRVIAAMLAIILSIAAGSAAFAQSPDPSYLTAPDLLDRALGALDERIGTRPKVRRVVVEPNRIVLTVRGARPSDVDEWRVVRSRRFVLFDRNTVDGPRPVPAGGVVRDVESGFFGLSEIALDRLPDVAWQAVQRAALEDPARVTSVSIERRISVLPVPAYGEIRWSIAVRSDRESATVWADASGRITGADLSQTRRAATLDLLAQDDWPMSDAQAALRAVIGDRAIVREVRVDNGHVSVDAEHPTDSSLDRGYGWNLSGVTRSLVDVRNLARQAGLGDRAPFRMSDIDLAALPRIKADARAALQMPDGQITALFAEKSTASVGEPKVAWRVGIVDRNGEKGEATLSPTGEVLALLPPPSRRPAEPWLAPAAVAKTLARIAAEFGDEARFLEISIDDERGSVDAVDPRRPDAVAHFTVTPSEIVRFGSPRAHPSQEARFFSMRDLAVLTPGRLDDLMTRTLARMNRSDLAVFRVTIERRPVPSRSDPILAVEIRAGKNQGWVGGRVAFDMDGAEVEVVRP